MRPVTSREFAVITAAVLVVLWWLVCLVISVDNLLDRGPAPVDPYDPTQAVMFEGDG